MARRRDEASEGPGDLFQAAPLPVAPLDDAQRLACLRLIRSEHVGPVAFRALINEFGGACEALAALPDLVRQGGRRQVRICPPATAEAELEAARRAGARPVFTIEPGYPPLLAEVEAPPPLLYVKGRDDLLSRPAVAVVGSREASAAGHTLARQLAEALGQAGFTVVSGLARGIDGTAHAASLSTGTVAVVAGGIDVVYPPEHAALAERIGRDGTVLAEQPPGFTPRGQDFPRRNRIIAGVSLGVLVVEAASRSGSLITARMAGEMGREVLAVPGHPLDPRAEGTNRLIRDGATMVLSSDDAVSALTAVAHGRRFAVPAALEEPRAPPPRPPPTPDPPSEGDRARILAVLGPAPSTVDEIARATGVGIRAVRIALLELSLAGRVEMHGGQLVSLRPG